LQVKKPKYKNKKTVVDNIEFDSKKEANRYFELKFLLKVGEIKNLEFQPKYILIDDFKDFEGIWHRKIAYIADFRYWDVKKEKEIVEDVKGMKTEVYRIKKKLLLHKFNIHFREI